jgi:DASH complex subunit DAM1
MADLENNFLSLQVMHESLSRFSESFAGFLYGMNMNAFCVDFPETPVPESFKRPQNYADFAGSVGGGAGAGQAQRGQDPHVPDVEATFLTTDTSFVENPPSSKKEGKFQTPAPASRAGRGRGGIPRAGRGGGIPVRGGTRGNRGSGIARGAGRGRGRGA